MKTRDDTWPRPPRVRPGGRRNASCQASTGLAREALALRALALLALATALAVCSIEPVLAVEPDQSEAEAVATETETDAELSEVLASHPAAARRAALMLAGHPEILLEIDRVQQDSAREFRALLAPYSRRERQEIWNLVRYPGLAAELARNGRKSRAELEAIADRYPPEERESILESGAERHELWVEIYGLELEARQAARRLLASADRPLRAAFEELEDRPALMSLLLDNLRWTTRLGSAYREDPAGVAQRFAALEPQIETKRRQQESAWAEDLADPASAEELERAARAFADAFGLEPETAVQPLEPYAAQVALEDGGRRSRTLRNAARSHSAYPYWLGYPDWYAAPLWAPFGLADHVGFRVGPGPRWQRRFIPVGLPSAVFLSWYHEVYRSGDRPNSTRGVRYYDTHRPRARRLRVPSAGILRDGDASRGQRGRGEADRAPGRRTSTAGDSQGRGAGRGSRADVTRLPPNGRDGRDRAP